ncbi:hypothetical protein T265_11127 [Opisthorchis viverrini]|uniref:Uncharacterized protein n=1 Tax=Opisthorchis viverrini TaxID=6198 RepID=A0A074Z446_OPIVI|nr:hypothetical protein T265_11127 [Opisthorchis viverrini]KER20282.1 hypothetical protein T265_11127 [Opisthorchis viverrini]
MEYFLILTSMTKSTSTHSSAVTRFRCLAVMQPKVSTRSETLSDFPSLERSSRDAEVGFEPRTVWR